MTNKQKMERVSVVGPAPWDKAEQAPANGNQPVRPALPIGGQRARRQIPGFVKGGLFMAAGAVVFFAAEAMAPMALKPSTNLGTYQQAMNEARKAGELGAQIKYEALLREIDIIQVERTKAIELGAGKDLENYKGFVGSLLKLYEASYARQNMLAEKVATMQVSLQNVRVDVARQSTGLLATMTGIADAVAEISKQVGNDSWSKSAEEFAERTNAKALDRVTEAGSTAPAVRAEGVDQGLPTPAELQMAFERIAPADAPKFNGVRLTEVLKEIQRDRDDTPRLPAPDDMQ